MSTEFSVVTAEIALVAATAKTVLQISAAANQKVKVAAWSVTFDGISVTEAAVVCRLIRSTTAGTGTASPPLPRALDDDFSGTIQAVTAHNFTAEPTMGDLLDAFNLHPQGGMEKWQPVGWEFFTSLEAGTADWLNIECTAPAAVNVIAKFFAEE